MPGADQVAEGPDRERQHHRGDGDGDRGDRLGGDDPAAVRHQGERREPGALAPLAGHGEDRDQRQDDDDREADGGREGGVGELVVRRPEDDAAGGQHRGDRDAGDQPEPGAGVEHLAELDRDDPGQRYRLHGSRAGRRTWPLLRWRSCRCSFSLGVGGELEEHLLEAGAVGGSQLGEGDAGVERDLSRPARRPRRCAAPPSPVGDA